MKRYVLDLEQFERVQLSEITRQGGPNLTEGLQLLILLNCDESEFNL